MPPASLCWGLHACCHARQRCRVTFWHDFLSIDFCFRLRANKNGKNIVDRGNGLCRGSRKAREHAQSVLALQSVWVWILLHLNFYAPLMIVFLSLPSSLSCTRASTLICNYLYFPSHLFTHLGAPASTFHDDASKVLFLDRSRHFSSSQDGKSPTFLCAWRRAAFFYGFSTLRVSNFVNSFPTFLFFTLPPPLLDATRKTTWKNFQFSIQIHSRFSSLFSGGKQTFVQSFTSIFWNENSGKTRKYEKWKVMTISMTWRENLITFWSCLDGCFPLFFINGHGKMPSSFVHLTTARNS